MRKSNDVNDLRTFWPIRTAQRDTTNCRTLLGRVAQTRNTKRQTGPAAQGYYAPAGEAPAGTAGNHLAARGHDPAAPRERRACSFGNGDVAGVRAKRSWIIRVLGYVPWATCSSPAPHGYPPARQVQLRQEQPPPVSTARAERSFRQPPLEQPGKFAARGCQDSEDASSYSGNDAQATG